MDALDASAARHLGKDRIGHGEGSGRVKTGGPFSRNGRGAASRVIMKEDDRKIILDIVALIG
jgi:hypothetical protein